MTNEHEEAREASMHEKLCAYVLGESAGAEKAEIERELLRSPELRAQRETIERTLGLVKDALASGDTLSSEAAAAVYSAAQPARPRPWRSSGLLRLAAGIGAVALGFAILRPADRTRDAEVAKLDDAAFKKKSEAGFLDGQDAKARPQGRADELARRVSEGTPPAAPPSPSKLPAEADKLANNTATEASSGVAITPTQFGSQADPVVVDQAKLVALEAKKQADAGGTYRGPGDATPPAAGAVQNIGYVKTDIPAAKPGESVDLGASYNREGNEDLRSRVQELYDSTLPASQPVPDPNVGFLAGGAGGRAPAPATGSTSIGAGPGPAGAVAGTGSMEKVAAGDKAQRQAGGAAAAPAAPAIARGEAPARSAFVGGLGYAGRKLSDGSTMGKDAGESLVKEKKREALRVELEARDDKDGEVALLEEITLERQKVRYYELPPAEQQTYLENECRLILSGCVRQPNERPRDMFFRFWGDNPFEVAALDPLSTFAADVDTASYALARRYLEQGNVPEKAQIRTEEFVNYFKADVAAPTSGVFAIHTDLTPSRFSRDAGREMLRVVVRGKDLSKVERPRMNLTFVVDVSGSMREQGRLEMVKNAMRLLITQLTPYDKIGIVKFSTDASVVLPLTNVSERTTIESAIAPLAPDGSTNSNAGLELGYGMALGGLDREATNRVVFLSDGVANVGETDPAKIAERVKPAREKGIYLNTIGVGMNNHNDVLLEQLADKADGMCAYIDTFTEAKKQLVDNFSGAFQPIARDVKIQVEFDPAQVLRYRLLGYENRAIADADFRNDKVDAGELGAGHQVTALYEIERQGGTASEKPLATVRVRWKDPSRFGMNPEADSASEISQSVSGSQVATFEGAGQSYRKAVMAAQFAEILRRSIHARGDSLDDLLNEALKLQREIPADDEFNQFVLLVSKSKDLILRTVPSCDELCQAIDAVRENQYRRAQLESLQKEMDQKLLAELQRQNDELEAHLRELVRRRLESR